MNNFVITVLGKDKPGIVASATKVLYEVGCNIEDSTSTILGGQFAMIIIVTASKGITSAFLRNKFSDVQQKMELYISVRKITQEEAKGISSFMGEPYLLSVYGADKPGIVFNVSQTLFERGININDLKTRVIGSQDKPVYIMILEIMIPKTVSKHELEKALKKVKEQLKIDITLKTVDTLEL